MCRGSILRGQDLAHQRRVDCDVDTETQTCQEGVGEHSRDVRGECRQQQRYSHAHGGGVDEDLAPTKTV